MFYVTGYFIILLSRAVLLLLLKLLYDILL